MRGLLEVAEWLYQNESSGQMLRALPTDVRCPWGRASGEPGKEGRLWKAVRLILARDTAANEGLVSTMEGAKATRGRSLCSVAGRVAPSTPNTTTGLQNGECLLDLAPGREANLHCGVCQSGRSEAQGGKFLLSWKVRPRGFINRRSGLILLDAYIF